jgi:hypothetical protein
MNIEPPVLAALVTGTMSLIIAVITFFYSRANQRDVEKLKAELAERKSDRDARRDYVYEARKRLYNEYEPLFFQFTESAEIALGHIQSLAERGREGNLADGGYLSKNSYYLKTTVYKLLVPVAIFKLINNRLTLVDLQVDSKIYSQYYLAKLLYLAYTQDSIFARLNPLLEYDPYHPGWLELRKTNPQVYYRQGFPAGRLDNALDSLISTDSTGANRVLSFGRFEEMLDKIVETDVKSPLGAAKDMFFSFHPQKRPLLWRILIFQAHIYSCVLRIRYETECDIKHLRKISESLFSIDQERRKYDWRQNEVEADKRKVLEEPFGAAKEYLRQKLSEPNISRSNPDA